MSNPSITADKTPWYQWDTGLTVTVSGGAMTECHFANRKQGTAYVQAVINGIARVPDELLQVAAPIKAYGYVYDGAGGQTYVEQSFEVIARNIPADYTYTKTAQKTIRDAEAARDQAVQASKDAKASELAAGDSAVEASNSAQSAGESASAAATSASNAAKSAGDAAKSASDAKAAASKTVDDASELLKTYTDNAKTSADNAATSASNAADAASAASGSASAAAQSATDASNAKAAAQTAKAEAETARNEAATSASNAATSATAAANSAMAAANSVNSINVISPKTVGVPASSSDQFDIAIGQNAKSEANQSIAIGVSSVASHLSSIALGGFAETSKDYEVAIGTILENGADVTREITHVSAPTGPNSASTKQYTDDNDAKTLTEAKKYTDANTSNALVRTVTDTIVTVDDAWTQEPLMLSFKGVAIQNGTPSVDKPVDVKMITSPSVTIAGRNLIIDCKVVDTPEPFTPVLKCKCGIKSSEHFVLSFDSTAVGRTTYANEKLFNYKYLSVESSNELPVTTVDVVYSFAQIDSDGYFIMLKTDSKSDIGFNATNVQFERGDVATAYEPYSGQSVAIALPEEHPYLASLPDGTADEVIIDAYGNVTLVASVTMYKATGDEVLFYDAVNDEFYIVGTPIVSGSGYSPEFPYVASARGTFGFATSDQGEIYMSIPGVITDYDSAVAWVKAHTPTFYGHAASVSRYSLGKVTLPQLKAGVSNVWIDGGMCGAVTMTYKRDINIAFDNLVQAVVAAAAGE